jgi:hypothetical protein
LPRPETQASGVVDVLGIAVQIRFEFVHIPSGW